MLFCKNCPLLGTIERHFAKLPDCLLSTTGVQLPPPLNGPSLGPRDITAKIVEGEQPCASLLPAAPYARCARRSGLTVLRLPQRVRKKHWSDFRTLTTFAVGAHCLELARASSSIPPSKSGERIIPGGDNISIQSRASFEKVKPALETIEEFLTPRERLPNHHRPNDSGITRNLTTGSSRVDPIFANV